MSYNDFIKPVAPFVIAVGIVDSRNAVDIIDDLTTGGSDKALSAEMGKKLNADKQAKVTGAATSITDKDLSSGRALVSDPSGKVAVSGVTSEELGCLDGVTSPIQPQLDGKAAKSHTHKKADITDLSLGWDDITGKPDTFAPSAHGHTTAEITDLSDKMGEKVSVSDMQEITAVEVESEWSAIMKPASMLSRAAVVFKFFSMSALRKLITLIKSTISSVFAYRGTVEALEDLETIENPKTGDVYIVKGENNLQYVYNGDTGKWDTLGMAIDLSPYKVWTETKAYIDAVRTWAEGLFRKKSDAIAVSEVTDLQSTLDGKANTVHTHAISQVTNLQSTLDGKAAKSHTHPLSQVSDLHADWDAKLKAAPQSYVTRWPSWSEVTGKPASYPPSKHTHQVADVTGLQAQLDGKQAKVTGGASAIVSSNLAASRALISDPSGKVAVSPVTATELGYLGGATSNIQQQIDDLKKKSNLTVKTISVMECTANSCPQEGVYKVRDGSSAMIAGRRLTICASFSSSQNNGIFPSWSAFSDRDAAKWYNVETLGLRAVVFFNGQSVAFPEGNSFYFCTHEWFFRAIKTLTDDEYNRIINGTVSVGSVRIEFLPAL